MGTVQTVISTNTLIMKLAVVFSLIVSSCLAQPLKFLGVDQVVADPPLALPRTALDVLHPGVGYLGHHVGLGHLGQPVGLGFRYPWLAAGHYYHHLRLPTYIPGHHFAPASLGFNGFNLPVHLGLPTITDAVAPKDEPVAAVAEVADVVDVSAEEEGGSGGSLITIQQAVGNIPAPPTSGGLTSRNPGPNPILPAGIVQGTQPKFVQVLFQNPKTSPHFPFVHNSKVSPILNEIREESAGIVRV